MKFGEIRRQRVSLPRGPGPGLAAQEFSAKANVFRAVSQIGREVAEIATEREMVEADILHRNNISGVQQQIAQNPTATQDQLKQWGILEEVRRAAPSEIGDDVPQHLWAPIAMRDALAQSTEMAGQQITLPGARRKYLATLDQANDRQIMRMTQASARQAVVYEREQSKALYDLALEQGQYEEASRLVEAGTFASNPAMRKAFSIQVNQARELSQIDEMRLQGNYSEAMDLLRDQDRESSLSAEQRSALYVDLAREEAFFQQDEVATGISERDMNFIEAYARATDPQQGISRSEIVARANRGEFTKTDYMRLLSATESPSADGSYAELVEEELRIQIARVQFNDYSNIPDINGDGQVTPEDAQMYFTSELKRSAMMTNADGSSASLLSAKQLLDLQESVASITEKQFEDPRYKRLREHITLTVGRGTIVDGRAVGVDKEGALAMSRALTQLQADIRADGASFSYQDWQANTLPRFITDRTVSALANLSVNATRYVSRDAKGNINWDATRQEIIKKISEAEATGRPTDFLMRVLEELDQAATAAQE